MKRVFLVIPCFLLVFSGCSSDESRIPQSPVAGVENYDYLDNTACLKPGGWGNYYPLRLENSWRYSKTISMDGEIMVRADIKREMNGFEEFFGREYMVEEERYVETAFGETREFTYWNRYRQDRSGLYAANVSTTQPPDFTGDVPGSVKGRPDIALATGQTDQWLLSRIKLRGNSPEYVNAVAYFLDLQKKMRIALRALESVHSPGDPGENELASLRYPLRRGATWEIRDDPVTVTATVERREVLNLPIGRRLAVRIRIDASFLGPNDRVYVWYSRCGILSFSLYAELDMVDPDGNVIGTFTSEEIEVLEGLDLRGRPFCGR